MAADQVIMRSGPAAEQELELELELELENKMELSVPGCIRCIVNSLVWMNMENVQRQVLGNK